MPRPIAKPSIKRAGSIPKCPILAACFIGGGGILSGEVVGRRYIYRPAQSQAWAHTQLILDVVPGRGGMFSLDNGREKSSLTRGKVFTASKQAQLAG